MCVLSIKVPYEKSLETYCVLLYISTFSILNLLKLYILRASIDLIKENGVSGNRQYSTEIITVAKYANDLVLLVNT